MKENEMGEACSKYVRIAKYIQCLGGKTSIKETTGRSTPRAGSNTKVNVKETGWKDFG
jgi:hypothetical protein